MGLLSVLCVLVIGVTFGALAGYYGGWVDTVLARLGDIFFALPLLLGALVITQLPLFRENKSVWTVVLVISLLAWPQMARITRGAVIEVRNADFVTAAQALGVSRFKALLRHVLPNALAPDHCAGHAGTRSLHRRRSHPVLPWHRPAPEHHVLGQ